MDKNMSQRTRKQVLEKLRRRYKTARAEHNTKLVDQAVQLLGHHRKPASRIGRRPGGNVQRLRRKPAQACKEEN